MYPVLISSLGIAVGTVTHVLRSVTYYVHDEHGLGEKVDLFARPVRHE